MKLVVFAAVFAFSTTLIDGQKDPLADVTSAIESFAIDFYQSLNYQNGSETYSEVGLVMALGMILRGAKGQTAAEIKHVLYSENITDDAIHSKLFKLLNDELHRPRNDLTLLLGNMVLVSKDIPIKDDYVEFITNNYHGVVKSVDFKNDGQTIVNYVNEYVSNKTFGLVTETLESPLSSLTKLALVNSMYIKGSWVTPFPKANTHSAPFTNFDKTISQVDTMHAVLNLKVCHMNETRATFFGLPLKGKTAMFAFLPVCPLKLAYAMSHLNQSKMHRCIREAKEEKTNIFLPKVRAEGQTGIESGLSKLGARSMFDQEKADLTRISDAKPLWVSKLIHKLAVNINEEGVDANEANLGATQKSSPGHDYSARSVRVNRQFSFGIYDFAHSMFLFGHSVSQL